MHQLATIKYSILVLLQIYSQHTNWTQVPLHYSFVRLFWCTVSILVVVCCASAMFKWKIILYGYMYCTAEIQSEGIIKCFLQAEGLRGWMSLILLNIVIKYLVSLHNFRLFFLRCIQSCKFYSYTVCLILLDYCTIETQSWSVKILTGGDHRATEVRIYSAEISKILKQNFYYFSNWLWGPGSIWNQEPLAYAIFKERKKVT